MIGDGRVTWDPTVEVQRSRLGDARACRVAALVALLLGACSGATQPDASRLYSDAGPALSDAATQREDATAVDAGSLRSDAATVDASDGLCPRHLLGREGVYMLRYAPGNTVCTPRPGAVLSLVVTADCETLINGEPATWYEDPVYGWRAVFVYDDHWTCDAAFRSGDFSGPCEADSPELPVCSIGGLRR